MKLTKFRSATPSAPTLSATPTQTTLPKEFDLTSLVPEKPAAFPSFPTIQDHLDHTSGVKAHPLMELTEAPPPKQQSLFQEMFGTRTDVLAQDSLEHPDRYDQETAAALAGIAGKRFETLTPAEHRLLSSAALDYMAAPRQKAPPTPVHKKAPPPTPQKMFDGGSLEDSRTPQVEGPGGALPAYWWV